MNGAVPVSCRCGRKGYSSEEFSRETPLSRLLGGILTAMEFPTIEACTIPGTSNGKDADMASLDEHALVDCVRNGDDRCFDVFVRRFSSKVMAVANRYLRSEADAADCFQDTFVAAFDSIDRFEKRSSVGAWLRGITVNQCLMRVRTNSRRREESIDQLLPDFDERGQRVTTFEPAQSLDAGAAIDRSRMNKVIRSKINELPDDYRMTLLLRDIDGYSTQETADILGIQVNAVKTRLHRARSALKTLLEPELEHLT